MNHDVGRQIVSYNRAGSDHRTTLNVDPVEHNDVGSEPAVIPDSNALKRLGLKLYGDVRVGKGVLCADNGDAWGEHRILTDANASLTVDHRILTHEDSLCQLDPAAVGVDICHLANDRVAAHRNPGVTGAVGADGGSGMNLSVLVNRKITGRDQTRPRVDKAGIQ